MSTLQRSAPEASYDPSRPYVRALVDAVPNMHQIVNTFVQNFWQSDHLLWNAVPVFDVIAVTIDDADRAAPVYHQLLPAPLHHRIAYEAAYEALFGDAQYDRYGEDWDSYVRLDRGLRRANTLSINRANKKFRSSLIEQIIRGEDTAILSVTQALTHYTSNDHQAEWESAIYSLAAAFFRWIIMEDIPCETLVALYTSWQKIDHQGVDPDMGASILQVFLVDAIPQVVEHVDCEDTAVPEIWRQPLRQSLILEAVGNVDRLQELTNIAVHYD